MINFRDFTDYCQALAIANKLEPTEDSVWRSICRAYSKKFNEPLSSCLDGSIDPETILLNLYEDQLEEVDTEENVERLMDAIYSIEDPEYEKQKADELEEFIEEAEREEEERIAAGKPIHKALKNESILSETSIPKEPSQPTAGGIDLSYLEKEEM